MGLTALIDGDLVVHRICSAVQREIQSDDGWAYWWSDPDEVWSQLESFMDRLEFSFRQLVYFSSSTNFRKRLEPTYKAQRTSPKPLGFHEIRRRCDHSYPGLEADDVLGLRGAACPRDSVIVTTDKDLLMVPGKHYNPYDPKAKIRTVDQAEGTYNFLTQVLTGDTTDNYPGCPGVGKVTAKKLLDKKCDWATVVDAYAKKDLTEEDAIHQARLAYILHKEGDYDWETGEVRLWTPETYFSVL